MSGSISLKVKSQLVRLVCRSSRSWSLSSMSALLANLAELLVFCPFSVPLLSSLLPPNMPVKYSAKTQVRGHLYAALSASSP